MHTYLVVASGHDGFSILTVVAKDWSLRQVQSLSVVRTTHIVMISVI